MPEWEQASVSGENLDSLGGRYQLISKLGAGGMCEVFLASARGLRSFHKLVVIKRMLSSTAMVQGSKQMFMDEAEITARFNHPNIVQTYEIVDDAEHLSIVMEFLEGQPLDRIFDLLEKSDVSRSVLADRNVWVRVIAEVLKGLHYAHELREYDGHPLNIVHRDISPQNLFLTYDGVVKIVDFGIAKAEFRSTNTEVGTLKGKVGYMAPEQALCAPVDRRTDIFSTGVVLWEFLAGEYMRPGDTLTELQKIVSSEATPALSTMAPDVPSELAAIVAKATAQDPNDRYDSAEEMRFELEEYLAGQKSTHSIADVGQAITPHFAQNRQLLRQRVREVVSGTPPGVVSHREPMTPTTTSRLTTAPDIISDDGTLQKMLKSSRRRKVITVAVVSAVAFLAVAALWVAPRMVGDPQPVATTAGVIAIESIPSSASVRLDGALVGTTPLTTSAAAGTHRITISKEGFTESSSTVETKHGETARLSLALSPVPAEKTPPEPAASAEIESDDKVPAKTDNSGSQGRPKPRAQWRPPKAKTDAGPVPKAQPAPTQPKIQIIDESSETKVRVDVID